MRKKRTHILVMGGGTGTAVLLAGLKHYPVILSAIITTADNAGSSGMLRKEFAMIPPGDIRQCLVALADRSFGYMNDRFQKGFLAGHTLGNLLIALFCQQHHNAQEAIDRLARLTGTASALIPMTLHPVTLMAQLSGGRTLRGEHAITSSREIFRNLKRLWLLPSYVRANPRAIQAIRDADMIVIGPGNLYTSIIPNLLVPKIKQALLASRATRVHVANLVTQRGHTDGFSVSDFVRVLEQYTRKDIFDRILCNTALPSPTSMAEYADTVGSPVGFFAARKKDKRYVGAALISRQIRKPARADPIAKIRNPFLHDATRLARAIIGLV